MLENFDTIWSAGMKFLPSKLASTEAKAGVLAIGLQESEFKHRRQLGDGPARGLWQFEQSGVRGVLNHAYTTGLIKPILASFLYEDYTPTVWTAIEHNDLLALIVARLLLYTAPWPLPGPTEAPEAWRQYLWCWRPGRPREEKWLENYTKAWQLI